MVPGLQGIHKAKGWEKGKELNIRFNERGNLEIIEETK